jgi:thiol-disulfide isomerase/thioredoxin
MAVAHVHLLRAPAVGPLASLDLAGDSEFELETTEAGALVVRFTGVGHVSEDVPLYVESPQHIEVDVRLGTPDYKDDFGAVVASGAFNGFSSTPLELQPEGRMTAVIESPDPEVTYHLAGATKTPHAPWIPGTDSDEFGYDLLYGYQSVIPTREGKATLVFDPSKLVRGSQSVEVRFRDPQSRAARHYAIAAEVRNRIIAHTAAQWAHLEGPDAAQPFQYDWTSEIADLDARLSSEDDPVLRQILLWSVLGIADLDGEIDPVLIHQALDEIAADSPLWSYAPDFLSTALKCAEQADTTGRPAEYLEQAVDSHPDPAVRASVLSSAMWSADERGDEERARGYYDRLVTEHSETWQAEVARTGFASDRKVMVGKTIPDFALTSLDDAETIYTPDGLQGSVYLIDFWATWCLPCVQEMPNIHEAYERYRERGFQILSVALGDTRHNVSEFRRVRWSMPWLHAFHGWNDAAIAAFEVWSIPKAILVDRSGRIVGVDSDVQGEGLQQTLARLLGERD